MSAGTGMVMKSNELDPEAHVRVHRNFLYAVVPVILFGLSAVLLAWSILRLNLPVRFLSKWPWRIQLLDVQSAATVATITGGLIFARAQYATSVRPMIGWTGRVVKTRGFSSRLVRVVRLVNGSTFPAVFHAPSYRVILKIDHGRQRQEEELWISRTGAIELLDAAGLHYKYDYDLKDFGPRFPMSNSSQDVGVLALFSIKAMAVIDELLIMIQATDQAGDTHQRIIYCMLGAERRPREPTVA